MKSANVEAMLRTAAGHSRAAAFAREGDPPEVVDQAHRRLRLAIQPQDSQDVPAIALDLVDAVRVGSDQSASAGRIVEQKPRLGLKRSGAHQFARVGTHVGLLESLQDFLEPPDDTGIGGDEGATIRVEHEPHRVQEMVAIRRANPRIAGDRPALTLKGVENPLGATEFDRVGFVEELGDEVRNSIRTEIRSGVKPRGAVLRPEAERARETLGRC